MQGYAQAAAEYEAKMSDPYSFYGEREYADDDDYDLVEEMLIAESEKQTDCYLWR